MIKWIEWVALVVLGTATIACPAFGQTKTFTITATVVDGEVQIQVDDSVVPDVWVSQHVVPVEAGLNGSPRALDLDDEKKYFPAVHMKVTEDEGGDITTKEFRFESLADVRKYLDGTMVDADREAKSFEWDAAANVFSRKVLARRSTVPEITYFDLVTQNAHRSYRDDWLRIIDEGGAVVRFDSSGPRVQWPDGTKTTGLGAAHLWLNERYKVAGYSEIEVPNPNRPMDPPQIFYVSNVSPWGYDPNGNRNSPWGNGDPVMFRGAIAKYLKVSPEEITVKVVQ